ncbi:MAG: patatin-like phospholipase family protein [Bacteriovoracaceae bacterium]|jgi:predicted acylesterase/phospholipase RssA|nr:patatin-like phospholipase family protein [Bacteriovoracaceae bacterium]
MTYDLSEFKNKKLALVLSGGVVKAAAWHIGVTLALEELGFTLLSNKDTNETENAIKRSLEIGTYVGSSAGAMISILLACGYTPQEIINGAFGLTKGNMRKLSYRDMFYLHKRKSRPKNKELFHPLDEFPQFIKQLLNPFMSFPGLFSTEGVRRYLLDGILDVDTFEKFKPDLFVVGTQLDHSQKTIFGRYNYPNPSHDATAIYQTGVKVSDAAAASMSVPPFYAPYPIKNPTTGGTDYYIDGEIRETLSTHVAEDNGCDIIISSWTHTPYHYHDEVGSLINYGLPSIAIQSIYLLIQKKIVASRAKRATGIDILNTVSEYMKQEKLSTAHRRDIMAILERKLNINPNVKLIDIYPDHHDYKLFFANSFSLNPKVASHAVKAGYKRAMQILSQPEFL